MVNNQVIVVIVCQKGGFPTLPIPFNFNLHLYDAPQHTHLATMAKVLMSKLSLDIDVDDSEEESDSWPEGWDAMGTRIAGWHTNRKRGMWV